MEIEKLNSVDKNKIRLEIKQVLISYLAVVIVSVFAVAALVIFLQRSVRLPTEREITVYLIIAVVASGVVAFFYTAVKDFLKDLRSGSKRVYSGLITDKTKNTNWGWHSNPAADSKSQPRLEEYFLVIGNQKVQVVEEVYNRFQVGDRVNTYYSTRSNLLLGIVKE